MFMKRVFLSLVLMCACAVLATAQEGFVDGVQMTTVKAPWVLRIVGQDLDMGDVKAKPDEASAYFMMTSDATKLNVSVFVEPVSKCKSAEACRDYVLGLGNPAWGTYQDLAKGKIGDASYFEFYRPEIQGHPVKMLDMYAEFVQDGYWIDMHISKVLYEKKDHPLFETVVNSSKFLPKTEKQTSPFDSQLAQAQSSTTSWLLLWDTQKCAESFTAMSSITRSENTQDSWVDYCKKFNGLLGPNTSRKLIGSALTTSLSPKTGRPLAILAYQSDFKNHRSIVEILALMLEKDGKWTVTNYEPH